MHLPHIFNKKQLIFSLKSIFSFAEKEWSSFMLNHLIQLNVCPLPGSTSEIIPFNSLFVKVYRNVCIPFCSGLLDKKFPIINSLELEMNAKFRINNLPRIHITNFWKCCYNLNLGD